MIWARTETAIPNSNVPTSAYKLESEPTKRKMLSNNLRRHEDCP
jgi:hypothetical protein